MNLEYGVVVARGCQTQVNLFNRAAGCTSVVCFTSVWPIDIGARAINGFYI